MVSRYAGADRWDPFFRALRESGGDLDWGGRWIEPFLAPFRDAGVRSVLELGCGTGNDAARLADRGYTVTAIDFSGEAVREARRRHGTGALFSLADIAAPLPCRSGGVDAVMSNVALHMFPDAVTRSVFAEIARVVRPSGVLAFHVNAVEDRPLRARRRPGTRELAPDYVLEPSGKTMHFFSAGYLRDLLEPWAAVHLDPVEIADPDTGEVVKRVWRGVARR